MSAFGRKQTFLFAPYMSALGVDRHRPLEVRRAWDGKLRNPVPAMSHPCCTELPGLIGNRWK